MNRKQLIVMWIGIVVFIFVGATTKTRYGRYSPPVFDYSKLATRLLDTVIVTAALVYTLRDKNDKKPKDKENYK